MAKLILLGSSYAIPTDEHDNTHFVIKGQNSSILIDCSGNTWVNLKKAGIDYESVTDIILTHCHPDHISGIPTLLMNFWLMGRKDILRIYGLHHTLDCVEKMMGLYEWETWPDFFPVAFHRLPYQVMTKAMENSEFRFFSSPVKHIVPTIGLRIESLSNGKVIAYSCDTEPCEQVIELGKDADILLHEATGKAYGHSSASQAGEIANEAGVGSLYFVHYPPDKFDSPNMILEAQKKFAGTIKFAWDYLVLDF
jgi:ribonuclease Z